MDVNNYLTENFSADGTCECISWFLFCKGLGEQVQVCALQMPSCLLLFAEIRTVHAQRSQVILLHSISLNHAQEWKGGR